MQTEVQRLSDFARTCDSVGGLGRDELIGIAVARGCRHYADFTSPNWFRNRAEVPHEALGSALLFGARDVDMFRCIRVGSMVFSDLRNSPIVMAKAAKALGVASRL